MFLGVGSAGRSKYRIRRYGDSDSVFLERKQKKEGVVRKWRTAVDASELRYLGVDDSNSTWSGHWYRERFRALQLRSVCQIRYSRTARVATSPLGTIRLTLDEGMVALPQSRLQFDTLAPVVLVDAPVILELKYRQEMPTIFKQLVQRFRLEPRAFSKYKLAVIDLGLGSAVIPEVVLRSQSEQSACRTS